MPPSVLLLFSPEISLKIMFSFPRKTKGSIPAMTLLMKRTIHTHFLLVSLFRFLLAWLPVSRGYKVTVPECGSKTGVLGSCLCLVSLQMAVQDAQCETRLRILRPRLSANVTQKTLQRVFNLGQVRELKRLGRRQDRRSLIHCHPVANPCFSALGYLPKEPPPHR